MSIVKKSKNKNRVFFCGAGACQAAITPQGELKLCLMIESPRFKILPDGIKTAWKRLSGFSRRIELSRDRDCLRCRLIEECKWCPARSWLYDRSFTSCVPELKIQALRRKAPAAKKRKKKQKIKE